MTTPTSDPSSGAEAAPAIPRLRLEELDQPLRAELEPRAARLGYLGELFAVLAHQPDTLLALMELAGTVRAPLPPATVELVQLTISETTGNHYERNQHEQLATRQGFSTAWLRDVLACRPAEATVLSEEERLVQRLALAVIGDHGRGATAELAAATGALGSTTAVALLLFIGYATLGSVLANTLDLAPPVQAVVSGEEQR